MLGTGTVVAHCPVSNTNLRSGIAPIRRFLDEGMRVGLGSDISGGHTLDMPEVLRQALEVSGLLWRAGGGRQLSAAEGFYLATKGGGSFFGQVGGFEPGNAFDALVLDDGPVSPRGRYGLRERFERMIRLCSGRELIAKYVGGKRLF
jgi:guanine deaminase